MRDRPSEIDEDGDLYAVSGIAMLMMDACVLALYITVAELSSGSEGHLFPRIRSLSPSLRFIIVATYALLKLRLVSHVFGPTSFFMMGSVVNSCIVLGYAFDCIFFASGPFLSMRGRGRRGVFRPILINGTIVSFATIAQWCSGTSQRPGALYRYLVDPELMPLMPNAGDYVMIRLGYCFHVQMTRVLWNRLVLSKKRSALLSWMEESRVVDVARAMLEIRVDGAITALYLRRPSPRFVLQASSRAGHAILVELVQKRMNEKEYFWYSLFDKFFKTSLNARQREALHRLMQELNSTTLPLRSFRTQGFFECDSEIHAVHDVERARAKASSGLFF